MGSIVAIPVTLAVALVSFKPADFIFWCKWIISYVYIRNSRKGTKDRFDLYDINANHDPVKCDFISAPQEIALESPLEENELSISEDEVYFYGVNSKSECLTVQINRRCDNKAQAYVFLKLSNGKVYLLKEQNGSQRSCCEKKAFTCGGLQVNYITPMRKWRIYFNGLLKEFDEGQSNSEKMVHVKFALLWRASSDVFDFTRDVDVKTLARSLAKTKWASFVPPLKKIEEALDFYVQSGIIMGTVTVEGEEEEREVYLFGERNRFLGKTSAVRNVDIWNASLYNLKNGSFVHLCEISIENVVDQLKFGFIVQPMGFMSIVVDFDTLLKEKKIQIRTKDSQYELEGTSLDKYINVKSKDDQAHIEVEHVNALFNSHKSSGIVMKRLITKHSKKAVNKVSSSTNTTAFPLIVPFSDHLCQNSSVTGGKGSSLGDLTQLSHEFQTFIVPNGFVVTTAAYEEFMTKDAVEKIKFLEEALYRSESIDIKEPCQRVMDEIIKTNIPQKLREAVENSLHNALPEKNVPQYAVRSSATGEDTEQMSAAGQMDTFLGVVGLEEILLAVKKCWASQFSHIAVQYKRQNGQVINSPMAVVIQKMIPCDVAGVLFTCDPLTGNPSIISITANYGLGESVVSASEDPDIIELKRDFYDNLSITSKTLGVKNRRIVLNEDKGTYIEEMSEKDRLISCLTDEKALRLGNLAVKIEKSCRSHRDIEWGFWNNNLYIFQSRPVTSGAGETDFEIDHESDAPMRVENEIFTVCNVGEVMPGALPTLSWDVLHKYFRTGMHRGNSSDFQSQFKPRYFPRGLTSMFGHAMFYCVDFLERMSADKETTAAGLAGLFGRAVEDDDLMELAKNRFGDVRLDFFKGSSAFLYLGFAKLIIRLLNSKKILEESVKAYSSYRIPVEKLKTSQETFNFLLYSCSDLADALICHMRCSSASSIWNMFILNILRKAKGGMDASVYSNFSQLLKTKNDVESADVPAGIERLASLIAKEKKPEEFKKMDIQEAVQWLESSGTKAGLNYKEFLRKHGHRCLREFDIRSKTWRTDPSTLIQLLKNLVGSKTKSNKQEDNSGKIISELNIGFTTRLLLKFLVNRSHTGVQCREGSKSLIIKTEDAWRQGYRHLAKLMVLEGRIPDEDLLYFMTLDEIKELLSTRSPKIISRANHRRKRYPIVDKYIFPEIMKGFPRPINFEDTPIVNSEENFCMKGTPVSQGVVKAFVRVAITLEEAGHLQPGEILVTYSTDIGWSPYFPMLSGVVTELGGHISHGAVVSREYGLPCVTSLHGATRQFKTGDYALLDGNKGILQRLPKPENSEYSSF